MAITVPGRISKIVEPGDRPEPQYHEYDPRCPIVAELIGDAIRAHAPDFVVEHVGSTAVPGCPGKGVVDMMLVFAPGELDRAKLLLEALGFVVGPEAVQKLFPEDRRPVRFGRYRFDDEWFRVNLHVCPADTYEVKRFRIFRDRLRANASLRERYVAVKQAVVTEGVTNADEYIARKQTIIREILGRDYEERDST